MSPFVQQAGEGLVEFPADDAPLCDEQLLEEGLVHQLAVEGHGHGIGLVAVLGQFNGSPERRLDLLDGLVGLGQERLGVGHLPAEPVLLGLEQVQRDGPGVVGTEQLLPLVLELPDADVLPLPLVSCQFLFVPQFVQQRILSQLQQLSAETDVQVVLSDQRFDEIDRPGLERALGALLVTAH